MTNREIELPQFAAIQAAVAEGFELLKVLDTEGVSEAEWARADVLWKARLVDEPESLERYRRLLSEAEDRLARKVEPLDDDVSSWASFLRVYSRHPEPFELLASAGLGLNDLSRLGRRWSKRFAEDGDAAAAARAELTRLDERSAREAELPTLRVEARKLRSSLDATPRWTPAIGVATSSDSMVGLDEFASIAAELRLYPNRRRELGLRLGLGVAAFNDWERALHDKLERAPELMRDFRVLSSHYEEQLRRRERDKLRVERAEAALADAMRMASSTQTAGSVDVGVVAEAREIDVTAALGVPVFDEPLPFRAAEPALDMTADALPALELSVLPFDAADACADAQASSAREAAAVWIVAHGTPAEAMTSASSEAIGETAFFPAFDLGPGLPFEPTSRDADTQDRAVRGARHGAQENVDTEPEDR